jgi:hypothetical protein
LNHYKSLCVVVCSLLHYPRISLHLTTRDFKLPCSESLKGCLRRYLCRNHNGIHTPGRGDFWSLPWLFLPMDGIERLSLSYPGSKKYNRSLYTCAQDVQITRTTNNMVNKYNISLNYKLRYLQNDPWVQKERLQSDT